MVCGLVQCQFCALPGIFQLLDWRGTQLDQRIYSVGHLPRAATEVFIRNMQSAYCDVTRHSHEVEALINLRQLAHIGVYQLPSYECLDYVSAAAPIKHPDWQQLKPEGHWWAKFNQ